VVRETLDKTRLGSLRVGDRVNLEHAATASTLMGGHIVQGHVDGVGRVAKVQDGEDWRVWVEVGKGMREFLVSKGSVCVEGVSLTVAGLTKRGFWVALIPTTLAQTTLGELDAGDAVNVEVDVIAKMVARGRITTETQRAQRKARRPARTSKRKSKSKPKPK
jgi:riboflavin synthase